MLSLVLRSRQTWLTEVGLNLPLDNYKLQMMFIVAMTYFPDYILVKIDRTAMANSL